MRSEWLGFDHNEIDIRIPRGVTSRPRTEQDHLLRIDLVDDRLDHPFKDLLRDRFRRLAPYLQSAQTLLQYHRLFLTLSVRFRKAVSKAVTDTD